MLDPATTCSLLSTYGRLDDLRAYAARRGDHEAVLDLLLARPGGAQQALAVLRQPSAGPELAYKCAPALVAQVGAGGLVPPGACLTGDSMAGMGGSSMGGVCWVVAPGCTWGTLVACNNHSTASASAHHHCRTYATMPALQPCQPCSHAGHLTHTHTPPPLQAPAETVDFWMLAQPPLDPTRLLPALVRFSEPSAPAEARGHVLRYVRFATSSLGCEAVALHNLALALLALAPDERELLELLQQARTPLGTPLYDTK